MSPFARWAAPLLRNGAWPTLEEYSAAIEAERKRRCPDAASLRFVEVRSKQARARRKQPRVLEDSYDGRIALNGEIPCLPASYHDWFNALVWSAFPRAKRALHQRQFEALRVRFSPASAALPNRRSREQDALTLFDEGGCMLVGAADALARQLCTVRSSGSREARTGRRGGRRIPLAADISLVIFGHALMEHLAFEGRPCHSIATVVPVQRGLSQGAEAWFDGVDLELAKRLRLPSKFTRPRRTPLLWFEPPGGVWLQS